MPTSNEEKSNTTKGGQPYDIDNLACFDEDFADSMDQACPGEINAQGADEAQDFCIDNLGAFGK